MYYFTNQIINFIPLGRESILISSQVDEKPAENPAAVGHCNSRRNFDITKKTIIKSIGHRPLSNQPTYLIITDPIDTILFQRLDNWKIFILQKTRKATGCGITQVILNCEMSVVLIKKINLLRLHPCFPGNFWYF